eukprot:923869-Pyramimonas_sp.AAC.1
MSRARRPFSPPRREPPGVIVVTMRSLPPCLGLERKSSRDTTFSFLPIRLTDSRTSYLDACRRSHCRHGLSGILEPKTSLGTNAR